MSGRLDGKVVVITGAAGEIGRATAVRFAGGGAHLVLVDLAGAPLNEVVAATKAAGSRAIAVEADVTRSIDVERYPATPCRSAP